MARALQAVKTCVLPTWGVGIETMSFALSFLSVSSRSFAGAFFVVNSNFVDCCLASLFEILHNYTRLNTVTLNSRSLIVLPCFSPSCTSLLPSQLPLSPSRP